MFVVRLFRFSALIKQDEKSDLGASPISHRIHLWNKKKTETSEEIAQMFVEINRRVNSIVFLSAFSESDSSSSEDDPTINDGDLRQALQPTVAPVSAKRRHDSSASSDDEKSESVPVRPHANVHVERTEQIQTIRSQLPIITEEQAIMDAIHHNLVVLICGETGSFV